MLNKNFYPTPNELSEDIFNKYWDNGLKDCKTILEPSAGKGDFIESFTNFISEKQKDMYKKLSTKNAKDYDYYIKTEKERRRKNLYFECVEFDDVLSDTLKGGGYNLIWDDFTTFKPDRMYELILMNPPFDRGCDHLLKAIEIQERMGGQIVCILNANTLKNDYSNSRKELSNKLEYYNADIEYVESAFSNAERKTDVEVAIIYLDIPMKDMGTLFERDFDEESDVKFKDYMNYAVPQMNKLDKLLLEYKIIIESGTKLYMEKYRMESLLGDFKVENIINFKLNGSQQNEDKSTVNDFICSVNKSYWRKFIEETDLQSRVPSNLRDKFKYGVLDEKTNISFNKRNVEIFYKELIEQIPQAYEQTVGKLFEDITNKYVYSDSQWNKSIHMFNGWKTNTAWKINKKCIIRAFNQGGWDSSMYNIPDEIADLNIVFENLSGQTDIDMRDYDYRKNLLKKMNNFETKIETKFFILSAYKKGTVHIVFKDQDLLAKFNILGCKGKNWLPSDFCEKPYSTMTDEEKELVKEFGLNDIEYDTLLTQKSGYLRLT